MEISRIRSILDKLYFKCQTPEEMQELINFITQSENKALTDKLLSDLINIHQSENLLSNAESEALYQQIKRRLNNKFI